MKNVFKMNLDERNHIRKLYNLIMEAEMSLFEGSTSGENVSHAKLTQEWGLPNGKENEMNYYTANMKDVMEKASSLGEKQKLSLFKPSGPKGNQSHFLAMKNNGIVTTSENGTKSIRWERVDTGGKKEFYCSSNGEIAGAGNGLLAFARALNQMRAPAGEAKFLIELGTLKGSEGDKQRYGAGIDMTVACNLDLSAKAIKDAMVVYSIDPKYRFIVQYRAVLGQIDVNDDEALKNLITSRISSITTGINYFIPKISEGYTQQQREQQIQKAGIKPLTENEYDFNSLFNQLKALRNPEEFDYEGKPSYGFQSKLTKMDEFSRTTITPLFKSMQDRYYENFNKWLKTYYAGRADIKACYPTLTAGLLGRYEGELLKRAETYSTIPATQGEVRTGYQQHKMGQ